MEYPSLQKCKQIALDTETTGLQQGVSRAFGVSITLPDYSDYYWDLRVSPSTVDWLNHEMRTYRGGIVCHNASFDFRMSKAAGINLPINQLQDTVIRASLINEQLHSYKLDDLAKSCLGLRKQTEIYEEMATIFGGRATRTVQMPNISRAPVEVVSPYARADSTLAYRLWEWQEAEIKKQGLEDIIQFETRLIAIFINAEMRGIRVDLDYTEQAMAKLTPVIDREQAKLDKLAGMEINVNSAPQVKAMFRPTQVIVAGQKMWQTEDGVPLGTTPGGGPSLNADVLREMNDPRAELILSIRSLLKTRDTFLGKHVLEHNVKGRVYPTINQSKSESGNGTGTGRLSYQDPAMQQIPSRNKETAAIVKPCFLPEEGQVWMDGDMNSFEVRIFAHLINNPKVIEQYRKNPYTDFHQYVADLTTLVRNAEYSGQPNAKQLNLSMIFNSGDGAIAQKMGMPWEWASFENYAGETITYKKAGPEAKAVIEMYHQRLPGVKDLAEKMSRRAKDWGYIRNEFGRKIRFPRGFKAYKASGILIQSTAADYNKENWMLIDEALGNNGHIILNTHDSYSMSVDPDWKPVWGRVQEAVEDRKTRVPLILDFNGVGNNWWDALTNKKAL